MDGTDKRKRMLDDSCESFPRTTPISWPRRAALAAAIAPLLFFPGGASCFTNHGTSSLCIGTQCYHWTSTLFAAGGFGSGGGSSTKKKSGAKKDKKSKRRSSLSEVDKKPSPVGVPPTTPKSEEVPKLDKWGLPPPTEDDIFPPMPPGTELIPISNNQQTSLTEIRNLMENHIELKALKQRFSEEGLEKNPPAGRQPMQLKLLHQSPPVLAIENFFTKEECQDIQNVVLPSLEQGSQQDDDNRVPVQVQSATFSSLAQSKRTSTSWFSYYSEVPVLLAKAHHVLGIPTLGQMEEPQIVRYRTGQEFSWHYDEVPPPQLPNGGQRLATLLVYLNDVDSGGGGTVFRDLKDASGNPLTMQPKLGSALLFFPAYRDGRPDDRTLHKSQVAVDEKWIIQMWIHEREYQAVLPPGNFQLAAQEAVDQVSQQLELLDR